MTQKKKDYENPYDGQCAILYAMNLIGAKWKIPILWHLTHYGILHYNELKRHLGGEADGLIIRKSAGSVPPSVTYELSDEGKKLIEPLDGLYRWGEEHRRLLEEQSR